MCANLEKGNCLCLLFWFLDVKTRDLNPISQNLAYLIESDNRYISFFLLPSFFFLLPSFIIKTPLFQGGLEA